MPSVNSGHRYRITEWYKSTSPVYFTLFGRDSNWQVSYLDQQRRFPASSTWTQASFVTDLIPNGINGLSFGLTLGSNGSLTVDDASFDDAAGSGGVDTTPPTVSMSSPTRQLDRLWLRADRRPAPATTSPSTMSTTWSTVR